MAEFALIALALWIVTHTIAVEIPVTANAPKPLSCQLCLSGWISLLTCVWTLRAGLDIWAALIALGLWATTVLIEAIYNRLYTVIL